MTMPSPPRIMRNIGLKRGGLTGSTTNCCATDSRYSCGSPAARSAGISDTGSTFGAGAGMAVGIIACACIMSGICTIDAWLLADSNSEPPCNWIPSTVRSSHAGSY